MSWGRIGHPSEMVSDRPGDRSADPAHRSRARKDRAWASSRIGQPLGEGRGEVPRRQPRQGRGGQRDELRGLREARTGHRRPGTHQRDVVDQADQPSQRAGADRRRNRGRRAGHQQGEAGNLAGHEADPAQSLGQGRRALSARHACHRARFATSRTTARLSRSKRASTGCCTSATCRGRARSAIPASWSRRDRRSVQGPLGRSAAAGASRWG